jgi:hypothetical protein
METSVANSPVANRAIPVPAPEGWESKLSNGDTPPPDSAVNRRGWIPDVLLLGAATVAAVAGTLAGWAAGPLSFKPLTAQAFAGEIGWLVAVALIIERAVEVIVMVFRDPQADLLDEAESQAAEALQSAETAAVAVAADPAAAAPSKAQAADTATKARLTLAAARRRTIVYRSGTKMLALRVGFVFGVAVSLAGVRALGGLLPDKTVVSALFTVVDVVITGAMLAGGSEGIHRMANVFTSFMDSLSTRADQSQAQVPARIG